VTLTYLIKQQMKNTVMFVLIVLLIRSVKLRPTILVTLIPSFTAMVKILVSLLLHSPIPILMSILMAIQILISTMESVFRNRSKATLKKMVMML